MPKMRGNCGAASQVDTSNFPEDDAAEQTEVADLTATLESESVLSLAKLKTALSEQYCSHDAGSFAQPKGWAYEKKGRNYAMANLANPEQFSNNRGEVEKMLEANARRRGRVHLGSIHPGTRKWHISSQALTTAVATGRCGAVRRGAVRGGPRSCASTR